MANVVKVLVGLAGLSFILAIVVHFLGGFLGMTAEGLSRASTNSALLAIALFLTCNTPHAEK